MAFIPDQEPSVGGFTPDTEEAPAPKTTEPVKPVKPAANPILPATEGLVKGRKLFGTEPADILTGMAIPGTALLDIMGAPARALSTIRGGSMSDPSSTILRPEIEKVKGVMPEGRLKFATEVAGQALGDPISLLTGLAGLTKHIPKATSQALAATSGIDENVIRAAAQTPKKELVRTAGLEPKIGQEASDIAKNLQANLPYEQAITEVLKQAPPIDIQKTLDDLVKFRTDNTARNLGHRQGVTALEKIDELDSKIRMHVNKYPGGEVPALEVRELRKFVDDLITTWKKTPGSHPVEQRAYMLARKSLEDALRQQAGGTYVNIMDSYAPSMKSTTQVQKLTSGTTDVSQAEKQARFAEKAGLPIRPGEITSQGPAAGALKNLDDYVRNPNLVKNLEDIAGVPESGRFVWPEGVSGSDYLAKDARTAAIARELGMLEGSSGIPMLSKKQGIRSMVLPILAAGGALPSGGWSLPAAALASPKVAVALQQIAEIMPGIARASEAVKPYTQVGKAGGALERAYERWLMQQNEGE